MLSIDLEFKKPAQNLLEDVISVFRNIEIVALFIACFIMGKLFTYLALLHLSKALKAFRSTEGFYYITNKKRNVCDFAIVGNFLQVWHIIIVFRIPIWDSPLPWS